MLEELTHGHFVGLLNTAFDLEQPTSDPLLFKLVEVSPLLSSPHGESFAILFRGPPTGILPQAIYRFRHAALDSFDLFIVPVRQDAGGTYYEANFNRLHATGS
ncbi:MAG: hypothetical protein NVS4B8_20690 [Herpetosiphon sp.]